MRFGIVGEGVTDFYVLESLLIGFFNDKNLPVTRFRPKQQEPFGFGNLMNYLSSDDFKIDVESIDYTLVQIDTKECADWNPSINNIGDDAAQIEVFIEQVKTFLIDKIGIDFYQEFQDRIIFAITVHEIECWLLPFHITTLAHQRKLVGCAGTLENIANAKGISINQKNFQQGKHYEDFSKPLKKKKELLQKAILNPSLKVFLENLQDMFPNDNSNNEEDPQ
jgi:hypothetical protein